MKKNFIKNCSRILLTPQQLNVVEFILNKGSKIKLHYIF